MGSCESLAKSPNLSFLPLKFPFEIRFTGRPVSRINQLPIDISFPLPPSPYTQSGTTFLFRTPPLLNHPAGCIVQKDYDKFDKYDKNFVIYIPSSRRFRKKEIHRRYFKAIALRYLSTEDDSLEKRKYRGKGWDRLSVDELFDSSRKQIQTAQEITWWIT